MSNLIKIGRNNELKRATLELPKYGELTDERVVQEMRGVFDGFEYDPDTQVETVFKTVEQIETYAAEVSKELEQADNDFKMAAITNAGAIAAKRWHFGFMISKCLKASKYGEGVANKIAAAANISLPYLISTEQSATISASETLTSLVCTALAGIASVRLPQ